MGRQGYCISSIQEGDGKNWRRQYRTLNFMESDLARVDKWNFPLRFLSKYIPVMFKESMWRSGSVECWQKNFWGIEYHKFCPAPFMWRVGRRIEKPWVSLVALGELHTSAGHYQNWNEYGRGVVCVSGFWERVKKGWLGATALGKSHLYLIVF